MKEFWSKIWRWLWTHSGVLFFSYIVIMALAGTILVRDPIVYLIQEFTDPWPNWLQVSVAAATSLAWAIVLVFAPPFKHISYLIHEKHSNPKNWVIGRRIYVDLPKSKITHMFLDKGKEEAEKYIEEINRWLKDNVEGRYLPIDEWTMTSDDFYSVVRIFFSRKSDAVRFKLVFGGE